MVGGSGFPRPGVPKHRKTRTLDLALGSPPGNAQNCNFCDKSVLGIERIPRASIFEISGLRLHLGYHHTYILIL